MSNQATASMSFVITAAYTVTFANTVYLMVTKDPAQPFSVANMEFSLPRIICGCIAFIMTMRFFFGNNQFIDDVMNDPLKSPWKKFYQFAFIGIQSAVLLVISYSIPRQAEFVYGMIALFGIEILWYLLSFLIDRSSVWGDSSKDRMQFLFAELNNLLFVVGCVLLCLFFNVQNLMWLLLVFGLFVINTIHDAWKNMPAYMGSLGK